MLLQTTQETIDAGKKIAAELEGGDILLLKGELGAGKTTLVKGLALGLGIKKEVTSPTFTLMNIYECDFNGIKKLVHIDTYRLKNEQELLGIGVEDYLGQPNILCVIEWPEKITEILVGLKTRTIKLEHSENGREIKNND